MTASFAFTFLRWIAVIAVSEYIFISQFYLILSLTQRKLIIWFAKPIKHAKMIEHS